VNGSEKPGMKPGFAGYEPMTLVTEPLLLLIPILRCPVVLCAFSESDSEDVACH